LDLANEPRDSRVLGPAPAPLARLKGEHRIQILVKSRSRRRLRAVIDKAVASFVTAGHNRRMVNIEIDPISIM